MFEQRWPLPSRPRPIAIIGAGGIVGDAHLPAYRAAALPVAGVYDLDGTRARATSQRFDVPCAPSLDALLAHPAAVFDLALPPSAISSVLERLPLGSTVLIQKPLGQNWQEASEIVALCERRRLVAAVNFQLRFSPMMLAIKQLLDSGMLGEITDFELVIRALTPWGSFPFLKGLPRIEILLHSIHYLDLTRHLLGEPLGVFARTLPDARARGLANTRTAAILDYGPSVRCILSVNHNHAYGPRHEQSHLYIEGTTGALVGSLGALRQYPSGVPDQLEVHGMNGAKEWQAVPLVGDWFPDAFRGPMSNLQRFAAGEDAMLLTSVASARKTMALVEACYAASEEKGAAPR